MRAATTTSGRTGYWRYAAAAVLAFGLAPAAPCGLVHDVRKRSGAAPGVVARRDDALCGQRAGRTSRNLRRQRTGLTRHARCRWASSRSRSRPQRRRSGSSTSSRQRQRGRRVRRPAARRAHLLVGRAARHRLCRAGRQPGLHHHGASRPAAHQPVDRRRAGRRRSAIHHAARRSRRRLGVRRHLARQRARWDAAAHRHAVRRYARAPWR